MWEMLALWSIVGATLVWFVQDERQQRHLKLAAQARRYAIWPDRGSANRRHEDELNVQTQLGAHILAGEAGRELRLVEEADRNRRALIQALGDQD